MDVGHANVTGAVKPLALTHPEVPLQWRYRDGMALDVTDATFQTDVIERSNEVAILVDLWAPWCGPCRSLGPIIERVVGATEGRVELVKVNVDENPQISGAFKVQSIPAVYALKDGKVVDGFVGALPEAQVKAFVAKLAPPKTEVDLLVEAGDELSLRRAVQLQPGHDAATVALADLLVSRSDEGDGEAALALLAKIAESNETRRIAALARVGVAPTVVDDATLHELDTLLAQVKTDDGARQRFLDLLEVMGDAPQVPIYRRKLAARLF